MLKLIAFLTMFVDHIGFFWDIDILRIIGRISFPIYCFLVVYGVNKTRNIKKYLLKLLGLAVVSQFIWIYIGVFNLNVVFLYFLYVVFKFFMKNNHKSLSFLMVFLILILSPYIDYGMYGVFLIFMFDFIKNDICKVIFMFFITCMYINEGIIMNIQFFALASIFLISKFNKKKYFDKFKSLNSVFYYLYPLHLIVLFWIYRMI